MRNVPGPLVLYGLQFLFEKYSHCNLLDQRMEVILCGKSVKNIKYLVHTPVFGSVTCCDWRKKGRSVSEDEIRHTSVLCDMK